MATIYELSGELISLQAMLENDEDLDPQVINDTLEAVGGEFEDKAEGYAKVIKNLQADVDGLKQEIERMTHSKQVLENRIDSMKKTLEEAMIATGKTKFKTKLFSFNIQKNPPTAYIISEKQVPAEFWVEHEPTLDKRGIIAYLKENGDQKWAELTQSESLRIR